MRRLARRARTWFALGVALGIIALVALDGADPSGATHGGEGGGFG